MGKLKLIDFFNTSNSMGIYCDTEEKAIKLLEEFHKFGKKWRDGTSYLDKTEYMDGAVYFNNGTLEYLGTLDKLDSIYKFDDIIFNNEEINIIDIFDKNASSELDFENQADFTNHTIIKLNLKFALMRKAFELFIRDVSQHDTGHDNISQIEINEVIASYYEEASENFKKS